MGGTARQVGSVLRHYGSNVAWWRVVNAAGDVPAHLQAAVREHWAAEGIAWKPNRRGCSIAVYGVDLPEWETAYAEAAGDLPPYRRGQPPQP
jgi:alkylated DNA nucleotide flippase Atl1